MEDETNISEFNLAGKRMYAVHLDVPPYGRALFLSEDSSATSHKWLEAVVLSWASLWPRVRSFILEESDNYGVEVQFLSSEFDDTISVFTGGVGMIQPHEFMGDRADSLMLVEFDDLPMWNFFLKGDDIVHAQPVI